MVREKWRHTEARLLSLARLGREHGEVTEAGASSEQSSQTLEAGPLTSARLARHLATLTRPVMTSLELQETSRSWRLTRVRRRMLGWLLILCSLLKLN